MFLSNLLGNENTEAININYLINTLKTRGYTLTKQKNRDLEAGISTISFAVEKNDKNILVFVMRLNKNKYVTAAYVNGQLIQEQQFANQIDLPNIVQKMFGMAYKKNNTAVGFETQLDNLRNAAEQHQKIFKVYDNYFQQMKTLPEYERFLNRKKQAYQQILNNSKKMMKDKATVQEKNQSIVQPLQQIQQIKQDLSSSNLEVEGARQQLTNIRQILELQIKMKKQQTNQLDLYILNEDTFKDYLNNLIRIKDLENKIKCMY